MDEDKLIQIPTEVSCEKPYDLHINDEFQKSFELEKFLNDYVLVNSFLTTGMEKEKIHIENYEQLFEIIIRKAKATKYIGVGVGGVYIQSGIDKEKKDDEYVLLYKRYHEPENQQWSILGGSCTYANKIEDTLKDKISIITTIDKDAITVKGIIKVNNHRQRAGENQFHYLSPSYYVKITNPKEKLNWEKKIVEKKELLLLKRLMNLMTLIKVRRIIFILRGLK